jgi:hypothetical protein
MLLSDWYDEPSRWTQNALARDKRGRRLLTISKAESLSLVGGLMLCYPDWDDMKRVHTLLASAIEEKYPERPATLVYFNNHPATTFNEVQELVRELCV